MKQSNKHYWHNKHLYTYSGHKHHAQQKIIKDFPSRTTPLPFGLNYGANKCTAIEEEKTKIHGHKAALVFATAVVNVQAKFPSEHGVQLLF